MWTSLFFPPCKILVFGDIAIIIITKNFSFGNWQNAKCKFGGKRQYSVKYLVEKRKYIIFA
jgi:hypothetical protein